MEEHDFRMVSEEIASAVQDELDKVCSGLREKHGVSFRIRKIGLDIGCEQIKLYVSPEDDDTLVFTVRVRQGQVMRDDYMVRRLMCQYEKEMTGRLAKTGNTAAVKAVFTGSPSKIVTTETTLEELLQMTGQGGILVRLALEAPLRNTRAIMDAMQETADTYSTRISANAYLLDNSGFLNCRQLLLDYPDVSDATIRRLEPKEKVSFSVEQGRSSIDWEEIIRKLGGE